MQQADGITNRNILPDSNQLFYKPSKGVADEGTRYGSATFQQEVISEKLRSLVLPVTTSLRALCVEMFPLNNLWRLPRILTLPIRLPQIGKKTI